MTMINFFLISAITIASIISINGNPEAEKSETRNDKKPGLLMGTELGLSGGENYINWIFYKAKGYQILAAF